MSARHYTSLYLRFSAVMAANPALARYRRQIVGRSSCCRPPLDSTLVAGIRAFLGRFPEHKDVLGPLVNGE